VKLAWKPVEDHQTIFIEDMVFAQEVPQFWTLSSYEIHVFKNDKFVSQIGVPPPATSYTYKVSATATTGGRYCFKVYMRGFYEFLHKPREETWHSNVITQTFPAATWHTLTWPPVLGIELNGYQVRATTDPAFIDNFLLIAGETDEVTNPSVTFYVAKPYTVYQKISAIKLLDTGPLPKTPGRMTVTRK
jgi:hypothetical protein